MLQFSGLGQTGDAYMECIAEHGREDGGPEMCATFYPQTQALQTTRTDIACSVCDPNTQWCDDGRCVPFTTEEQAEWAASGKPPTKIVTTSRPSLIPGISNKALAIIGLLGLGALLMYKRS